MAFSNVSYTGDGSTAAFSVPFPYLFQTDVAVTVNGTTPTFVWTNPALVTITPAPVSGSQVLIKRTTDVATLEVVFEDGSTVQASDINTDGLQMLYLAQEQQDGIAGVIAAGAAATAAAAAATAAAATAAAAAVPMVGDSGSGGTAGLVPAPPAGSAAANKVLGASGAWVAQASLVSSFVFIESFGGKGDGTTDNSPALTAAYASFGTKGGSVVFGAGVYKFNSAVAFTCTSSGIQGITLTGAGPDVTQLLWPSSHGLSLTLNQPFHVFNINNLSIQTSAAATSGFKGLQVLQNSPGAGWHQNMISRVVFGGNSGTWGTACALAGVANTAIDTVEFFGSATTGVGLTIAGIATGFRFSLQTTISNCIFFTLASGIVLGDYWQGLVMQNTGFIFGGTNILVQSGSVSGALSQFQINNCEFSTDITGSSTLILLQSPVNCLQVSNSLFLIPNGAVGINVQQSGGGTIVGNNFIAGAPSPTGNAGIIVGTLIEQFPMTITGNCFNSLPFGMNLASGSAHINVQSNAYLNCTTNTANGGTGNTIGGGSA